MTAAMTCTRCRKPVITLNPSTLGASGVGDLIAEVWNDHTLLNGLTMDPREVAFPETNWRCLGNAAAAWLRDLTLDGAA